MSHSRIPPQGPNPFAEPGGSPEPERRDFGARQAALVAGAVIAMLVFAGIIAAVVGNAQSEEPDGFGSSCEATSDEGYLDGTDDGYGLDDETDDYGFGEGTTEDCW